MPIRIYVSFNVLLCRSSLGRFNFQMILLFSEIIVVGVVITVLVSVHLEA